MVNIILYAIPFFALSIILEQILVKFAPDEAQAGYEPKDTLTSLSMASISVLTSAAWKIPAVIVFSAVFYLTPFRIPTDNPISWIALFFLEDLCYYCYHRAHHRVRLLWADHVVHHSSQLYNLTTALRRSWTGSTALPGAMFWLPLTFLGFSPWMIFLQQSISLLYQFFLHTERIGKLPRPIEFFFNTPSHHRVHHGSNPQYIDTNYGGVLIIWDRLFGTFVPEKEKVVYGLTKNVNSYNIIKVEFHIFVDIWNDVKNARNWKDRLGYIFKGPGWEPKISTSFNPSKETVKIN
ncbi:MAG: sterol desaturase family protein [Mycobacteriaceae bacterium]